MKYIRRRKNTRLDKGCYRLPLACFITFCVEKKHCLLGKIKDSSVALSDLGKRVEEIWLDLEKRYPHVSIQPYIIMPNHFHAIVKLAENEEIELGNENESTALFDLVRGFKSFSTHEFNRMKNIQFTPLWQRGYYDHVIRDQNEYELISSYIQTNPAQWSRDKFYVNQ